MFVKVDSHFLRGIASDSDRIPSLYYSRNWLVRQFFWMRLWLIAQLIQTLQPESQRKMGLDFGGGGGVFLPTLSTQFDRVCFVDLESREAYQVIKHYRISNVEILAEDIAKVHMPAATFDVIVAADVLEHFADLSVPTQALRRWLKPKGILLTSLPTENWLYNCLRKLSGLQKPKDHYHTGYEVESYLKQNGFRPIRRRSVPLFWCILPLFLVTAWQLDAAYREENSTAKTTQTNAKSPS
ncbi:methyltransferase domain-containing protein [Geitlerinema sp. PCC 9228]|jgi:predicted TPR repeat methyltransferase|uniref:methyltransferase domain-containing protein n=1 Tax=Geitlerinema sp. PCC 9228 TaxID=111611 RepID=UPI0008F9BACA|nr:methyltransferase domain-containing protein [Geitlerinema sp. PCC 9228]